MIPFDSVFAAIGHTLWSVSWQVTVLIAFIGILSLFFRKASSSFRYFLWCIVLARLCIPFKLALPLMSWSYIQSLFSVHLPSFTHEIDIPSIMRALPEVPLITGGTATPTQIPEILPLNKPEILPIIMAVLWLSVVLGTGILIIRFIIHTHCLLKQCPSIERVELVDLLKSLCRKMGIKRIVLLRYLSIPGHNEPSVVGIFRPAIYLPPSIADTWNVRDIEPVLLHELSHIRRHDLLINMVQAAVQVFYFFHPLVWLVNWRIRVLREEVCDDLSIQMLDLHGSHYIKSILNFIEEPQTKSSWVFSGIGFSEGNSTINKRVKRIMKINYKPGRKLGVLSVALLLVVGTAGLVVSSEQHEIGKSLTGDKTNAVLKETGVFDKIKIEAGKPLDIETKKQISKYLTDPADTNKIRFYIAIGWGEQLRPPDRLKRAGINLVEAVKRYTNLNAKVDTHVAVDSRYNNIDENLLVYICADSAFKLTKTERKVFGDYLRKGGFAVIDNGDPGDENGGQAGASLRNMLRDSLGNGAKFEPIPNNHPIYHCFFDFDGPPLGNIGEEAQKRFKKKGYLEGIWIGKRLAVIYCDYGYGYQWSQLQGNDPQIKFGVNLVVYALLQENGIMTGYKETPSKSTGAYETYLGLYNSTNDPSEKVEFLRNIIQISAMANDTNNLVKYSNMMIESDLAEGKKPEKSQAFYKEEAYYYLADTFEKQGDFKKAVDYYLQGFTKFPNSYFSSDMLLKVGVLYLTKLNTEADALDLAAKYFKKYINTFPSTDQTEMVHYYLGFCYYNGRRFTEAAQTFKSFADKYPNSEFIPEAVFYYADCNYNLGNFDEAVKWFNTVIARYPNHEKADEAYFTKAWALFDMQREEEGINSLKQLVEKYPKSKFAPKALFTIAEYYRNVQKYEDAEFAYQDVLKLYPESEAAKKVPPILKELRETTAYLSYEKAFVLFVEAKKTGDVTRFSEAAELLGRVVRGYPETEAATSAFVNAMECWEKLGEWEKALSLVQRRIEFYGKNVPRDLLQRQEYIRSKLPDIP